jgi:alpha-beta hydrolase superfamily lysophospholipase
MDSTSQGFVRRALLAWGLAALSGCAAEAEGVTAARTGTVDLDAAAFTMADGARLPYRAWLPQGRPSAVILALHGFNDSRDAWELPAPRFAEAGFAVYAPDQRGFGAAPLRGHWAGSDAMAADAAELAEFLRRRHPGSQLILMGESMGGAVLLKLATSPLAPRDCRYVFSAPAVWGRARMNILYRGMLWLGKTLVPGMTVSRPPPTIKIVASDNREALIRLSSNPLTIRNTLIGTTNGLVNLMDEALAATASFRGDGLFLYGAHDDLVPKEAMRTAWGRLPPGARLSYYKHGYHLLMRDLERAAPISDVISWISNPGRVLPSGGEAAALGFLAERE